MKEESSDDEFTYSTGPVDNQTVEEEEEATTPTDEVNPDIPTTANKESIQLLVQRVEELVSTPNRVDPLMFHTEQQKCKLSRVKEWLNCETEKPIDSCDASGECTSGESDEDRESQSSEDLNDSIVTCRPQALYDSSEVLTNVFSSPETCKVRVLFLLFYSSNQWNTITTKRRPFFILKYVFIVTDILS